MTTTIPTISENRFRQLVPRFRTSAYLISSRRGNISRQSRQTPLPNAGLSSLLGDMPLLKERACGDWLEIASEQLAAIAELEQGWDSYGGDPPSADAIEGAWNLLQSLGETRVVPQPHIYPSRSGGIQLEWELRGKYLDIELLSGTEARYFFSDSTTHSEAEGMLREGESLDEVITLIDSMCG